LENLVDLDFRNNINVASEKWQAMENRIIMNQIEFEHESLNLLEQDDKKGRALLAEYSNRLAYNAVKETKLMILDFRTKMFGY
jgi:hypothetical protein